MGGVLGGPVQGVEPGAEGGRVPEGEAAVVLDRGLGLVSAKRFGDVAEGAAGTRVAVPQDAGESEGVVARQPEEAEGLLRRGATDGGGLDLLCIEGVGCLYLVRAGDDPSGLGRVTRVQGRLERDEVGGPIGQPGAAVGGGSVPRCEMGVEGLAGTRDRDGRIERRVRTDQQACLAPEGGIQGQRVGEPCLACPGAPRDGDGSAPSGGEKFPLNRVQHDGLR